MQAQSNEEKVFFALTSIGFSPIEEGYFEIAGAVVAFLNGGYEAVKNFKKTLPPKYFDNLVVLTAENDNDE